MVGQQKSDDGTVKQKYVTAISLLKDVVFEETHDNSMNTEASPSQPSTGGSSSGDSSNTGDNTSGGNTGGSTGGDNGGGGGDFTPGLD